MGLKSVVVCAFILLLHPNDASGQDWDAGGSFSPVPGVQFQWRKLDSFRAGKQAFFEWKFVNQSDSVISCLYRVRTDSGEERLGKIVLGPHTQKLSGWYFSGDAIERLECTDVTYRISGRVSP